MIAVAYTDKKCPGTVTDEETHFLDHRPGDGAEYTIVLIAANDCLQHLINGMLRNLWILKCIDQILLLSQILGTWAD